MSVDYGFKAQVLKTDLCKKIKELRRKDYYISSNGLVDDFNYFVEVFNLSHEYGNKEVIEAIKINDASYHRVSRLKERIESYLSIGQCIWLTLTFNDDTLANTKPEKRRRYVREFLKSQSPYYVANIDYGKENEREHYHAILVCDYVDMSKWSYGFAYTERIKNHLKTSTKLSKYVSKLTNHAIKETTKRAVYIYSR